MKHSLRIYVLLILSLVRRNRFYYALWDFFYGRYHRAEWTFLELTDPELHAECRCVTLLDDPSCDERRVSFSTHAQELGWEFSFWAGVDGRTLSPQDYPSWVSDLGARATSGYMNPGEVGLLIATRELYEWALAEHLGYLVVFEDDAIIQSPPRIPVPKEFDIVFFNNRFEAHPDGTLKSGHGTYGYVLSRSGLTKMLEILEGANEPIDLLIGMYAESMARFGHYLPVFRDRSKPMLQCYHSGPLVVHGKQFPSLLRVKSKR